MRARVATLALLPFTFSSACTDRSSATRASVIGGTVAIVTSAEPDGLLPTHALGDNAVQIHAQIFERLAYAGPTLETWGDAPLEPGLAEAWVWSDDSLSIAFRLRPRARWHDGTPVTADDVRFTFDLVRHPESGAPVTAALRTIDSVTVRDAHTVVYWFRVRHPEQLYHAASALTILPAHLLGTIPAAELRTSRFARAPIGSGPFRFARWTAGQSIELVADSTNDAGRPSLDRVVWVVVADQTAALARLEAGEADFMPYLPPARFDRIATQPHLRVEEYGALEYAFLSFNLRWRGDTARPHPLFADRALRRAVGMAVDRPALVQSVLDSLGIVAHGPFVTAQWTATGIPDDLAFDPSATERTLDSLGWRRPAPGAVRRRAGRELRFAIAVPSSSSNRMRMAVLIQEMLRRVGIRADIEATELATFLAAQAAGTFDAALGAWMVPPSPEGIRQTWSGDAARDPRGLNYGRYASAAVDAQLDSAAATFDRERAARHYARAYGLIASDAPAIFLYEPVMTAVASARLVTPPLRAGSWWRDIREWQVRRPATPGTGHRSPITGRGSPCAADCPDAVRTSAAPPT